MQPLHPLVPGTERNGCEMYNDLKICEVPIYGGYELKIVLPYEAFLHIRAMTYGGVVGPDKFTEEFIGAMIKLMCLLEAHGFVQESGSGRKEER